MKAEIILSLYLLITSCHQEIKYQEIDWEQYPVEELSHPKKIVIPEGDFDAEQQFNLINDRYFFCCETFSQAGELHLYRLDNDTLKWQGLITKKGEGPLEMLGRSNVYSTLTNKLVLLSSSFRTKIFTLPDDRISDISDLSKWQGYTVPEQVGFINEMLPIDTTRFLLTTVGDVPSMFATYHLGDTALTFIPCPYPDDGFKNASKAVMYDGLIHKHPSKELYFYQCTSGHYMYTFELKDNQMENITYLYNEPPVYKLQKDGINTYMADETIFGGVSFVTEKYIYLKLNDFTMGDLGNEYDRNEGYPCWFNNQLRVFDWSGKPVKTYNLDAYISDFVVDSHDQTLYAITKNVETDDVSFMKYDLK